MNPDSIFYGWCINCSIYPWHCLSIFFLDRLSFYSKEVDIDKYPNVCCASVSLSNGMSYGLIRLEWIYIFIHKVVDKDIVVREERSKKWEKYYSHFWRILVALVLFSSCRDSYRYIESQYFLPINFHLFSFFSYPHVPSDIFICNDFKIFIFLLFDWSRRHQI